MSAPWMAALLSAVLLAIASTAHAAGKDDGLWRRLAGAMSLGNEYRPEVQRFIQHYAAHPKSLETMLARAEPYLGFILDNVERRGLPGELALLPAIESGWHVQAVSVSAAEGLWQFIPKTGAAYGLLKPNGRDHRRDPVASTHAALELLSTLHRQHGDWPLALAAYNAGGQKVREAMQKNGSRNFWRLDLPQQTRDYVPRLLAIAAIVRRPARFGVALPAHRSDVSIKALPPRWLSKKNPTTARTRDVTSAPPVPAPVLGLRLSERLGARASAAVTPVIYTAPPEFDMHIVETGETLESVAQRFGVSVSLLDRLNPAIAAAPLRAGQPLLIAACASGGC